MFLHLFCPFLVILYTCIRHFSKFIILLSNVFFWLYAPIFPILMFYYVLIIIRVSKIALDRACTNEACPNFSKTMDATIVHLTFIQS